MALKKELKNGLHLYVKIGVVEVQKDAVTMVAVHIEKRNATGEMLSRDSVRFYPVGLDEQAPFLVNELSKEDNNPLKAAYIFIKTQKTLFSDFEDA